MVDEVTLPPLTCYRQPGATTTCFQHRKSSQILTTAPAWPAHGGPMPRFGGFRDGSRGSISQDDWSVPTTFEDIAHLID